jgi:hypothetical protein
MEFDIRRFATIEDVEAYSQKHDLNGFYFMPEEVYFDSRCPGLTRSQLQPMLKSAKHFRLSEIQKEREETEAMRFGSMFHAAMEHWDRFLATHRPAPLFKGPKGGTLTGKKKAEAMDAWAAENRCLPISEQDLSSITFMRQSIVRNRVFGKLFDGAYRELVVFATEPRYGILLKCRIDLLKVRESSILAGDYKSCLGGGLQSEHSILNIVNDKKNPLWFQQAFYLYILDLLGCDASMKFIFCEKEAPFCMRIADLSEEWLEYGGIKVLECLDRLHRGRTKKIWPGYDTRIKINFPRYMQSEMEEYQ